MLSECESYLKISSPDRCVMVDELSAYFYFSTNLCINYLYIKNIYVKQSAVLANPQAGIEKITARCPKERLFCKGIRGPRSS